MAKKSRKTPPPPPSKPASPDPLTEFEKRHLEDLLAVAPEKDRAEVERRFRNSLASLDRRMEDLRDPAVIRDLKKRYGPFALSVRPARLEPSDPLRAAMGALAEKREQEARQARPPAPQPAEDFPGPAPKKKRAAREPSGVLARVIHAVAEAFPNPTTTERIQTRTQELLPRGSKSKQTIYNKTCQLLPHGWATRPDPATKELYLATEKALAFVRRKGWIS